MGEVFGRRAFPEERTAKDDNTQREDDEDDEVYQMHSFPLSMGRAASAWRIFSRSGALNL